MPDARRRARRARSSARCSLRAAMRAVVLPDIARMNGAHAASGSVRCRWPNTDSYGLAPLCGTDMLYCDAATLTSFCQSTLFSGTLNARRSHMMRWYRSMMELPVCDSGVVKWWRIPAALRPSAKVPMNSFPLSVVTATGVPYRATMVRVNAENASLADLPTMAADSTHRDNLQMKETLYTADPSSLSRWLRSCKGPEMSACHTSKLRSGSGQKPLAECSPRDDGWRLRHSSQLDTYWLTSLSSNGHVNVALIACAVVRPEKWPAESWYCCSTNGRRLPGKHTRSSPLPLVAVSTPMWFTLNLCCFIHLLCLDALVVSALAPPH